MEHVRIALRTDRGLVRSKNEDSCKVVNDIEVLLIVCDGMGGAAKGEVASRRAVDIISAETAVTSSFSHQNVAAQYLRKAMCTADLRISNEAAADPSKYGMGTTTTAMITSNDHLVFAQVGDSRGYVMRGNRIVQVTRDQTVLQDMIDNEYLTEDDPRCAGIRHIINQALGNHDGNIQAALTLVELRRGDVVLLCSDGLTGMLTDDQIKEVLITHISNLEKACEVLVERANAAGGRDNITVVLAQFNGEHLAPPSAEDIAQLRRQELVLSIT